MSPNPAMVDEPVAIRTSGLQSGERVTIRAELVDGADAHWASEAQFIADGQGAIDTATQAPVEGSYEEVSASGLVWSMRPTGKGVDLYESPAGLEPQMVDFRLMRNGQQAASVQLKQLRLADGLRLVKVTGKLHGVLFVPAATGPHPGVVVLGGWEGGVPMEVAAWLASHGFSALALAYFGYEDLPPALEGIPLEYFGGAISWMMSRPEVVPNRIAVLGMTRGAEAALQVGSLYPEIKAVVAYAPVKARTAASTWYGTPITIPYAWTLQGQPLAYTMPRFLGPQTLDPMSALRAAIPIERTEGPVLLIAGEDDPVWPSSMMADEIAGRLKKAHFSYPVEVLKYPHAGQQAGWPEIIPTWQGVRIHPVTGRRTMRTGGTPEGNAKSTLDAIPKVLEFLQKSLGDSMPPTVSAK